MVSRPVVGKAAAKAAAKVMDCLAGGDPITVEQLKVFDEMRVFSDSWCSCLAFAPTGFCHHRCLPNHLGVPLKIQPSQNTSIYLIKVVVGMTFS